MTADEIAKYTLYAYWVADAIALCALIAAIWGGKTALKTLKATNQQLENSNQQLENAKWNALLSFEKDMNDRRQRLSDVAQKLIPESPEKHKVAYGEALESYLNTVERLAASVLKEQFPESEMKASYRNFIASTIKEYEKHFGAGSSYPRTIELNEKWRDK